MIEAIIFDCFGVIIADALETLFQKLRSTHPERVQEALDILAAGNRGMLERNVYRSQLAAIFDLTFDEYQSYLAAGEIKDQRVLDYAKELRATYKTAILSNVGSGGLARRFNPGELEQSFDLIVVSGEIGYAKPEPRAYGFTAQRLGVRLEACVMVDDREEYCLGAQGVGMHAIQYADFDQMKTQLSALLHDDAGAAASQSGRL